MNQLVHHSPAGVPLTTACTALGLNRSSVYARRRAGSVGDEERAPGVCCVGVPVSRPSGRVNAAISIAMPKARFQPENVAGWVRLLHEAATRISRALGLFNGR